MFLFAMVRYAMTGRPRHARNTMTVTQTSKVLMQDPLSVTNKQINKQTTTIIIMGVHTIIIKKNRRLFILKWSYICF